MEAGRAPVWKEGGGGPGRVWDHQQLASGGPPGPSVLTAFLRGPTGEWGGSWAAGPLLTLCPLPVLYVTLGRPPPAWPTFAVSVTEMGLL